MNAGSFHLCEEQASIFPSGMRAAFSKGSYTSPQGFQACFSGAFFCFSIQIFLCFQKNKMQHIVSTFLGQFLQLFENKVLKDFLQGDCTKQM